MYNIVYIYITFTLRLKKYIVVVINGKKNANIKANNDNVYGLKCTTPT